MTNLHIDSPIDFLSSPAVVGDRTLGPFVRNCDLIRLCLLPDVVIPGLSLLLQKEQFLKQIGYFRKCLHNAGSRAGFTSSAFLLARASRVAPVQSTSKPAGSESVRDSEAHAASAVIGNPTLRMPCLQTQSLNAEFILPDGSSGCPSTG